MTEKITVNTLKQMKISGEKIACLTSYDASYAKLQDTAGVDVLLVGDSLGMVLHGEETTLNVSMTDMIYHTRLVSGACQRALVISDMPVNSYTSPETGLSNAKRLVNEGGAEVVKLEGGKEICETVALISQNNISVCGHLGLTPQSISNFQVQAKTEEAAKQLKQDALALQKAGAVCLVLECIPSKLAADVTQSLDIPVIGIGAGVDCDAQVLVVYDMLGLTDKKLKFCKNFLIDQESIANAIKAYVDEVKNKTFPLPEHSFE
ncbi:MAG: 3-methyl-2-oxobutanoate hydroxymethyltransferase [Proteobacteria bacterium]|nr:3-methyl-2-oxobutanoate hydroxymethyltransferase [Pseudomonadota bacterium]NOG61417.1 3-methyl-2-oxobutanoate hydroxymethyltransferase [Pseudomonadota bacterium]